MSIPAGALTSPTTITVVAKGGPYVAYEMLPHGLKFLKPASAVQGLSRTSVYGTNAGNELRVAYLPSSADMVAADGSVAPSELEAGETNFSGDTPIAESHVWIINHFSRYILISGAWVCVEGCKR